MSFKEWMLPTLAQRPVDAAQAAEAQRIAEAAAAAEGHRTAITDWWYECSYDMQAHLAQMYLDAQSDTLKSLWLSCTKEPKILSNLALALVLLKA